MKCIKFSLLLFFLIGMLCSFKPSPAHLKTAAKVSSKYFPQKATVLKETDGKGGIFNLVVENKEVAKVYFRELTPRAESFSYFVAIDNSGTILFVHILDYPSKYGLQVTRPRWSSKFSGKRPSELIVGKNVDAVSGATLTVNELVQDIKSL